MRIQSYDCYLNMIRYPYKSNTTQVKSIYFSTVCLLCETAKGFLNWLVLGGQRVLLVSQQEVMCVH